MAPLDRTSARKLRQDQAKTRRATAHRMMLATLAVILVSIFIWCLLLLFRSLDLRQDLAGHQRSMDDIRHLRAVLERPMSDAVTAAEWPRIEALQHSSESLRRHPDVDLQAAAQRLSSGLDQLHRALEQDAVAEQDPVRAERIWDASFSVLKAVTALEEQLQQQISTIYDRLSEHWRSLNVLVFVCLLLCASNLGLLHLTHRRRVLLEKAHERAVQLSSHDALTGLWNRDAILKMVRQEIARSRRLKVPVGLILSDIDRFREINGLIGQEQADTVLQEVAWRLGSLVRPYDTMGRFGGDSFLVVLPTCDKAATGNVVRRLQASINEQQVEYGLGRMDLTLSFVYLTLDSPEDADLDLVLHRLQEGLVQVKASPNSVLEVDTGPRVTGVRDESVRDDSVRDDSVRDETVRDDG